MLEYHILIFFSIFIIVFAKKDIVQNIKNDELDKKSVDVKLMSDPLDPIPDGSAVDPQYMIDYLANQVDPVIILPPTLREDFDLLDQLNSNQTFADGAVLVGDRIGGSDVATVFTYMGLVYNDYLKAVAGPAAIINANWALSSTLIAPDSFSPKDLIVYTGVRSGDANELSAGKKFRVREIKVHTLKNGHYSTMMLMKCCPSFTSFVTLPGSTKTYNIGYPATFLNYVPTLKSNVKPFTETCECDSQPGWDPVRSLCIKESPSYYNGANEKGSLLFVDGVFAGINLWPTNIGGEPYTDIAKYLQWITDTAI